MELPDFLRLSEEDVQREKERQERLRRDFNSRARLSSAELEAARAMILESDLRKSLEFDHPEDEKNRIADQLAEVLAAQGRFIEASQTVHDETALRFYAKAAAAVFDSIECSCQPQMAIVDRKRIIPPKYHIVKEIYSIRLQDFAHLLECDTCGNWIVSKNNPLPAKPVGPEVSDLTVLAP